MVENDNLNVDLNEKENIMGKYRISKVMALFRKFGGWRLIRGYARLGVLGVATKECLIGMMKRKSADKVYYAYYHRIIWALQKQYRPLMLERLVSYENSALSHQRSKIIWFCWLQGMENAPEMVKTCYRSLERHLTVIGYRLLFIDNNNWREYVEIPDYIVQRWEKKQIPPAQFADLLRLELLIEHGGTWIDSTVLCTGDNVDLDLNLNDNLDLNLNDNLDLNLNYLDADLFFFQFRKKDEMRYRGISNWFMTACTNHPLLMTLRDMLYAYWKDYDCVLEYFVFHRFFDMIAAERPEEILKMPYAYSPNSLSLGHNMEKAFNQETWSNLISKVCFHKLTYKVEQEVIDDERNYYNYIIRGKKE